MNERPSTPDPNHSPGAADDSDEFVVRGPKELGGKRRSSELPPSVGGKGGPLRGFLIEEDDDDGEPRSRVIPEPLRPFGPDSQAKESVSTSDKKTASFVVSGFATIGGVLATVGVALSRSDGAKPQVSDPLPSWVWPVVVGLVAAMLGAAVWAYWLVQRAKLKEVARERNALESAADRLRERMGLPSLVDFNRVLLDRYHGIATDQATKAYRSSRFAMAVGLVILNLSFFAGWRLNAQGDRVFVGSVGAVGTAFTAYLSRTYMQTYERALQQLNQYFNQPVLNGYFLNAERIADTLPDERRTAMLEQVVADILESGKEMHRNVTAASPAPASPSKASRGRRRAAQAEASIPAQQDQ
ncbi:hypothetical protein [Streptomyces lasalocidi]|uniref:DUF4231 domain-containing protein n=1 Tax=Streptomyces lasalocidi TaxID=324833 RepID=A0A4U5W4K3_STRLS|nr:hypothetical protein [Streptomyces lasalocidi]TKS96258.1 hypothetical protein E4U91_36750 [Streptomyces lasalocidi]